MKPRKVYVYLLGAAAVVLIVLWLKNKRVETNVPTPVESASDKTGGVSSSKVKVTVIYETLCPDSMAFFGRQLGPTYKKLGSAIDLDLVPWGKASYQRSGDSWTFTCQHGQRECHGNKIHACVLNLYDLDTAMKFVQCSMTERDPVADSQACATEIGLDWSKISACADGAQGSNLLQKYGVRTETLKTPLVFVPWILINDQFSEAQLERSIENLLGVVCDAYSGVKPAGCSQP